MGSELSTAHLTSLTATWTYYDLKLLTCTRPPYLLEDSEGVYMEHAEVLDNLRAVIVCTQNVKALDVDFTWV